MRLDRAVLERAHVRGEHLALMVVRRMLRSGLQSRDHLTQVGDGRECEWAYVGLS